MRNGLERHFTRALLLALLDFKFLLFRLGSGRLFSGGRLLTLSRSCAFLGLFALLFGRRGRSCGLATTSLDRDLLLLGPAFSHFDSLKLWKLVNVIDDADGKLSRAAWHVGLFANAASDVVLGNCGRKSLQKLRLVTVVDLER